MTPGLEEQIFTAIAKPRPPLLKSFLDSNELDRNWFIASFAAARPRKNADSWASADHCLSPSTPDDGASIAKLGEGDTRRHDGRGVLLRADGVIE